MSLFNNPKRRQRQEASQVEADHDISITSKAFGRTMRSRASAEARAIHLGDCSFSSLSMRTIDTCADRSSRRDISAELWSSIDWSAQGGDGVTIDTSNQKNEVWHSSACNLSKTLQTVTYDSSLGGNDETSTTHSATTIATTNRDRNSTASEMTLEELLQTFLTSDDICNDNDNNASAHSLELQNRIRKTYFLDGILLSDNTAVKSEEMGIDK